MNQQDARLGARRIIGKGQSMVESIQATAISKLDPEAELLEELKEIFSAAANSDAIRIFEAAKDGIESSTRTMEKLDLTQKRYYTNLKKLIDAGLIEKMHGAYRQTTLGKICQRLADALKTALKQKDRLDLVDRLNKSKTITLEETEEIMHAILKDTNIIPGERISDLLGPVRMADTWDKVVQDVVEYIDNAKEVIYFATQYMDMSVIEGLLKAAQRGVSMRFLVSEERNISGAVQGILKSLLTDPKTLKFLFKFVSSPDLQIKYAKVPYTFIIVDHRFSMVEVAKPYTNEFSLAFFFHNAQLSQRLAESFEVMWETGREVKVIEKLKN